MKNNLLRNAYQIHFQDFSTIMNLFFKKCKNLLINLKKNWRLVVIVLEFELKVCYFKMPSFIKASSFIFKEKTSHFVMGRLGKQLGSREIRSGGYHHE